MPNLLHETIDDIRLSGRTPDDIIFIGDEKTGHECSWEEFISLADREYDAGFGSNEVILSLVIVFSDGQKMWRDEYDGSECWVYSIPFKRPSEKREIKTLFVENCGENYNPDEDQ